MERTSRKLMIGKVVSVKNDKTITISIDSSIKHPLYSKRYVRSKKFAAHDEKNEAKLNDIVQVMETKPYSKTKKFRLVKVIETSKDGE